MTNDSDFSKLPVTEHSLSQCFMLHFLLIMTTEVIVPILGKWTLRPTELQILIMVTSMIVVVGTPK